MEQKKIIIFLSGGTVVDIFSTEKDIKVEIKDFDNCETPEEDTEMEEYYAECTKLNHLI